MDAHHGADCCVGCHFSIRHGTRSMFLFTSSAGLKAVLTYLRSDHTLKMARSSPSTWYIARHSRLFSRPQT